MKTQKELTLTMVAASSAEYEIQYLDNVRMPSITHFETPVNIQTFTKETIQALKHVLDYDDVVVKCSSCGQWGAKKTVCKHCGSPVG